MGLYREFFFCGNKRIGYEEHTENGVVIRYSVGFYSYHELEMVLKYDVTSGLTMFTDWSHMSTKTTTTQSHIGIFYALTEYFSRIKCQNWKSVCRVATTSFLRKGFISDIPSKKTWNNEKWKAVFKNTVEQNLSESNDFI